MDRLTSEIEMAISDLEQAAITSQMDYHLMVKYPKQGTANFDAANTRRKAAREALRAAIIETYK